MKHPEDDLQMAMVSWFDYQFPLLRDDLHHSPNEGKRSRKVNKAGVEYSPEAIRLARKGTKKGFPDLFLYIPRKGFHGLAIEVKAGKGDLTESQEAWIGRLDENGYIAVVVRSLDEFMKLVVNYLR